MPAHLEGAAEDIDQTAGDIGCRRTMKSRHGEMNSSPPRRARVSTRRTTLSRRRATSHSKFIADAVPERIVLPA